MLDDILSKKELTEMIGEDRFASEEEFKTALHSKLQEALVVEDNRIGQEAVKDLKRFDLYVYDSLTKRETLVVIGLKTVSMSPTLTAEDVQKFQEKCKKMGAVYGVLMTETEIHIYEFKDGQITEVEETRPLNHVDYEFSRVMTTQKWKDLLISRKAWVIAGAVVVLLMILSGVFKSASCKTSGPIKAEVNSSGEKVYYLPESSGYDNRITGDQEGERRFCEEKDAQDAGWTLAK